MTPATDSNSRFRPIRRLFDPATLASLFRDVLPGAVTPAHPDGHVRVERCWPGRRGEFVFEWSLALAGRRRCALFGLAPVEPCPAQERDGDTWSLAPDGLRGVRRYLPEWNLLVHSSDCDPALPHLAECLDAGRMAGRLQSLWAENCAARIYPGAEIECRTLGYRPGRRAAIAYRPAASSHPSEHFLGKTFRDERGEGLALRHAQLNEQLAAQTRGRVRVPAPVGYLPQVRMAVFSWAVGRRAAGNAETSPDGIAAAVDALVALHRTSLDHLPEFSVDDECNIVNRWYAVLERLAPSAAAATESLRDRLLDVAGTIAPTAECTIHRDFYDRQLIIDRRTTTLLDLDTLARGSPGVDLGNLLAHSFFAALAAGRGLVDFAGLTRRAVGRYQRQAAPVNRRTLTFFCSTALFRVGAVHTVRAATRRYATSLWALAEHLLKELETGAVPGRRGGSGRAGAPQGMAPRGSA